MSGKDKKHITEDRIILNSLGLLDKNEKDKLKYDIANSSGEQREEISEFNNLVSLFPKMISGKFGNAAPSAGLKEKLLSKINKKVETRSGLNKEGFGFMLSSQSEWTQHPEIAGIKFKVLAKNDISNYLMLLLNVDPDTTYPAHKHHGAEECYVISGDLYAEGKTMGPGDFHHAEAGSDHDPLYTKNGCTIILVVDPVDYA